MKVIIISPYYETGGPEALHQLCDAINNNGGDAYIWYYGGYYGENYSKPHPAYKEYNIKLTPELIDKKEYVIVLPESEGKMIPIIKNAKIYFWWLSVDNNNFFQYGNTFTNLNIHHLYQSNYALWHLLNNEAIYYQPLFDYINDEYVKNSLDSEYNKEDIVCFNPRKAYECTYEIIKLLPDIKFVPLTNMSRSEVINTLKKSKVYIDFGYHPGKERFPREAALTNNCIISGFRGSAIFYNDMPIDPLKYKFNLDQLESVADRIKDCLENYDERIKDFSLYKSVIINQKEEFINQVKQSFL